MPETTPLPPSAAVDGRVEAVRAYFAGLPLADLAEEMVAAADWHGLDWRLLPVIGFLESTGGKYACNYNAWGWASCRGRAFTSWEDAVETVAATLASYQTDTITALCIWNQGATGCRQGLAAGYLTKASRELARLGAR